MLSKLWRTLTFWDRNKSYIQCTPVPLDLVATIRTEHEGLVTEVPRIKSPEEFSDTEAKTCSDALESAAADFESWYGEAGTMHVIAGSKRVYMVYIGMPIKANMAINRLVHVLDFLGKLEYAIKEGQETMLGQNLSKRARWKI